MKEGPPQHAGSFRGENSSPGTMVNSCVVHEDGVGNGCGVFSCPDVPEERFYDPRWFSYARDLRRWSLVSRRIASLRVASHA